MGIIFAITYPIRPNLVSKPEKALRLLPRPDPRGATHPVVLLPVVSRRVPLLSVQLADLMLVVYREVYAAWALRRGG